MSEAPTLYRQGRLDQTEEQRRNAEAWDRQRAERAAAAIAIFDPAIQREQRAAAERAAEEQRQRDHPDPRAERAEAYAALRVALDEVGRVAAHLATATEVLACAERTEAEARAGDDRILDAASAALREAIEHGRDIAGIADPRLPDKLQLDDAVAGRGIAERTVADIEAAHASAVRLVARRKAAVDAAEVALVVDIATGKAAAVAALRAQVEPLLDWIEAAAGLRVQGPGGLHPITLPAAVRRALAPADPVLHGRPRPLRFFTTLDAAIEAAE